jgi:hypothetical protein
MRYAFTLAAVAAVLAAPLAFVVRTFAELGALT